MPKASPRAIAIPPRTPIVDRTRPVKLLPKKPWWHTRRPWPPCVRFENGPVETTIDRAPLSLPVRPGTYGCAAQRCVDAWLAEGAESDVAGRIWL
jgi:hypothetical protein